MSGNNIYKTRQVTRLPAEQQFNQTFLWTIEWPLFDISHLPSVSDNEVIGESKVEIYQQLLRPNTSIREQRFHQPPQPTNDIVQLAASLPKASSTTRSSTAASSSTPSPVPPGLQPPPGIPLPKQLPGAHLRPPTLTSTPASASTSTAPRPVPPPPAPPQTHRPAGRHLNRIREVNMVDDAISTGILHLDVNESPEEAQQSATTKMDKRDHHDSDRLLLSVHLYLPRPVSESMESTEVGASSSSSNLSDIKQRLVNGIKDLLDFNIERNSIDLNNNKQQPQQDNIMSVPSTMVPTSTGSSTTSVLPQHQTVIVNEDSVVRQLNQLIIGLKIRDNNLYQTASASLLNYYDNFSSIFFLANSTPINLNIDTPVIKRLNDFINNMRPTQRTTGTTSAYEYFICLTEAEHQRYQQLEVLAQCTFEKLQQQKPRLHNDAISALNYVIYIASTTTSENYLPNTPNDSVLYLYSFIVVPSGSTVWSRYHHEQVMWNLNHLTTSNKFHQQQLGVTSTPSLWEPQQQS